jgi:hypothetical protein
MISLAGNRTSGKDVSGKYPFRKISIQVIESRKKYIRAENRTTVTEIIRYKSNGNWERTVHRFKFLRNVTECRYARYWRLLLFYLYIRTHMTSRDANASVWSSSVHSPRPD